PRGVAELVRRLDREGLGAERTRVDWVAVGDRPLAKRDARRVGAVVIGVDLLTLLVVGAIGRRGDRDGRPRMVVVDLEGADVACGFAVVRSREAALVGGQALGGVAGVDGGAGGLRPHGLRRAAIVCQGGEVRVAGDVKAATGGAGLQAVIRARDGRVAILTR